ENKVEYEYILAPKSLLNQIKKTGELTVVSDLTFNDYSIGTEVFEGSCYFHHVEYLNNKILNELDLKSGDTWRIKTNLQLIDFYEKYGLNLEYYDRLQKNKEYIVIYLDNYSETDIFQWSVTENDNNLKLNYLVKEIKEQTKDENNKGWFIIIEKSATENEITASIEYTEYKYLSYNVFPNDENTKAYDFYKMYLSENKPDWKYKLISDFNTLSSAFYKYGKDEKENGITAEDIFVSTVFEENYVLALYLTEGNSGAIKNTFYNARVSESNILYLYAFHSSNEGNEAIYEMLYFIIIPKSEIPSVIGDVEVQATNEIVYNGPFESVSIMGPSKDAVKIDITHLIINNQAELEKFFIDYTHYELTQESFERLQNIDFESNFVLICNRQYYKYHQGDFVNYKTTLNGIASITFMIDPSCDIIIDEWDEYYFDIVIIPKHYLKYQIDYFYIRFAKQEREEAKDLIENQ
ncbi:MAG: hypothetical protein II984_02095, partial [Clostridia bacterium]|nr:hypothetical protein [Clostridia bacterium]